MKLIVPGVFDLITMFMDGTVPAGVYYGAAGLAPFHDFEDQVPQDVKDLLMKLDAGLKDGSVSTGYAP
jgi:basic membrane protein A